MIPSGALVLIYLLPYIALGAWCFREFLQSENRKTLALAMAVALCGASLYAVAAHANPWSSDSLFYHKDDASYHRWGAEIAQRWAAGERPPLGAREEIGTLHTGYYRFVAGLYYGFGPNPYFPLALNILACATLPLALFAVGRAFADRRTGCIAGWIGALYPTFWFHSAFLMRDVWITIFFLGAVALWLQWKRGEFPNWRSKALPAFMEILFLYQLFLLRYYLVAILIGAWALFELFLGRRRLLAWGGVCLFIALALAARLHPDLAHFQDRLFQSFTWAIPRHLDSFAPILRRFAIGPVKLFLAPLPWATEGGYSIDYFLWPGQWILYLFLLPFGVWAMAKSAVRGPAAAFSLIVPFIAGAYGFSLAYGGSVARQRMFLDALLIVFAALGLAWWKSGDRPRRLLIVYYIGLLLFVASHIASLFYRGIW